MDPREKPIEQLESITADEAHGMRLCGVVTVEGLSDVDDRGTREYFAKRANIPRKRFDELWDLARRVVAGS